MFDKNTHLHISITVTGRCNRGCEYCHFYASHKREEVDRDMDWSVFRGYVSFIKKLLADGYNITARFSGGEPLFIKDGNIFMMSDYLFEQTGLKPYVMTNGHLLSSEVIEKAYNHNIGSFVISCENPFKESEGAEHVDDVLDKYIKLQNNKVPLELGLVLVENSEFKNMKRIADYFYERAGEIPPLSEKNFDTYERPSDVEISDLYNSVLEIIKNYNGITDIHMFPYIVPELYNNTEEEYDEYLVEFPLDDVHGYGMNNYEKALEIMNGVFDKNNIPYICANNDCEFHDYCKIIKWVWMDKRKYLNGEKLEDYCKLKHTIVKAYYDALYDE